MCNLVILLASLEDKQLCLVCNECKSLRRIFLCVLEKILSLSQKLMQVFLAGFGCLSGCHPIWKHRRTTNLRIDVVNQLKTRARQSVNGNRVSFVKPKSNRRLKLPPGCVNLGDSQLRQFVSFGHKRVEQPN